MADYRNDRDLDRVQPKTVQAERSGSSIFLIVAAVIALLAILWFAFSGGEPAPTATTTAPSAMQETPAAPGATTTAPAVPDATIAPEGSAPQGCTTTAP